MSWITVLWSMNSAVCLTLAAFYGVVWCKQRDSWVHLLFSSSAVAAAAISAFELFMMNARTVEQYQLSVRWVHVPTWLLTVSFVAFVQLYLHAGRRWLAWSIYSLRTLVLILNFIFPVSINFRAITDIRHFPWGGGIVSVPVGVPNPWGLLSQVSLLLLLIFSVDATITVWRRGDRRRAVLVGGSMILGAILAWHVPLVIWGAIDVPFFLGFTYTGIVAAMGYELSSDMARVTHLDRELEFGEERFRRVVEAAPSAMIMVDKEGRITLANPQAEKTFGYSRAELLGQSVEMLVPERLRSDYRNFRHDYFSDAQARPMGAGWELFGRRKDGSEVPVEIGLSPIHTSKGLLVLASIVDISERKQAELEAARQRHDLAHLARVTTLGELSSSLAHELTHPITAILSNAQAAQRFLVCDDVDLNELREILNDIVTQDERAAEVIHRLRLLFKKGEPQKHTDEVDVNEVVTDVLKLMRHDLINQSVTVDTDLSQNLPLVACDRVQL